VLRYQAPFAFEELKRLKVSDSQDTVPIAAKILLVAIMAKARNLGVVMLLDCLRNLGIA
jgi:hypothetical protein